MKTIKDKLTNTVNSIQNANKKNPNTNINRIAKFEKISFEEFCKSYKPTWIEIAKNRMLSNGGNADDVFTYNEEEFSSVAKQLYDGIKLPQRSTSGSAGYDFFFPYGRVELVPNSTMLVPTGIKCYISEGWVLMEFPRSSLGFNYRIQLDNTVGIIDSDYYNNPSNEGHIMIKITNDSRQRNTCVFEYGAKFCQGIFLPYGITFDDNVCTNRDGGLGSTGQ